MQTVIDRINFVIDAECSGKAIDFADRLGINSASISKWRSGSANPSAQTIQQISDTFGYNRDWLVTGEGEPRALASADQRIIDNLTHAMKHTETPTDRLLRAVASAYAEGHYEVIDAMMDYLAQLVSEYRAQSPPSE